MRARRGEIRDRFDWPLFVAVAAIAVMGVVNLYSATSAAGPAYSEMYIQQIYWLSLGSGVAVLIGAIDYRVFERYGFWAYGGGIALLLLVFLLGKNIRGSVRWIPIGSFSLQPSEFMKIGLIIALAKYLHNDPKTEGRTLIDLVVPGLLLALPMGLILKQPDLGTALLCAAIFATIMVLTRLKLSSFLTLVTVFVVSAPLTWTFLEDYQKDRLTAFWNPQEDILDTNWHAHQSLVSIGNGGLTGKGYLQGTQNQHHFLPDQHSDFPFSVWAEESGLLGVGTLLTFYAFLILWGIRIATLAKDRFGAVMAIGVTALIFWHTIINIGMVMGLLPVVGVTLPLFSYGGSSVLTVMIGVGLLMSISIHRA